MTSILIFGGTGSLGQALIKRYLKRDQNEVSRVIAYSRDEAKHWTIRNQLADYPGIGDRLQFIVGDIRDKRRVAEAIKNSRADHVIIAAALKQVDTCELSPSESILTNLIGTQNVVEAICENQREVHTVLFVSTDKACSPVNVYGMCKAVSERLVTCQAIRHTKYASSKTGKSLRFLGVRYGNVLESRGSIIPLFKYQAENAKELTVTHPDMTRFVMTLDDSVDLIQRAIASGESGEIWIPKLPAMKIGDLANIFAKRYNKPIKIVGLRPGEKMHEALINDSESVRTKYNEQFKKFVIGPAFKAGTGDMFQYTSADDVMSPQQLEDHLNALGILDAPLSSFQGRTIDEIVKDVK